MYESNFKIPGTQCPDLQLKNKIGIEGQEVHKKLEMMLNHYYRKQK